MAEQNEQISVDAALVKRYNAAAGKGEKAEADFLLKLFNERGKYADVRKLLGKGPGWTERRLDKLTGSHPAATMGRQRNGATTQTKSPAKSPRLGSITANFASGHATRMSQPPSISIPPAVQNPFTAATIGLYRGTLRRTAFVPSSRR